MSKLTVGRIIQNQFDLILFQEGSFSPLNWMLSEGYLDYRDYQNWRKGKSEYLEDHFKVKSTVLFATLERLKDYASSLHLKAIRQTYASTTGQQLHSCRSAKNEFIFSTVYEPAEDRMQMDLFFDSAAVCTQSDLIAAIIERRSGDIAELLDKLESNSPDKHQQFVQLLLVEKSITQSKQASDKKIQKLKKITPLAFEVLGRFSHDFLTPLWHKLSIKIASQHFVPDSPDNHLSYTAFKGFQWQLVLQSIKAEEDWDKQAILLFRYAEAYFKLNKESLGIANWFKLFIQFPENAKQLIEKSCNRLLFSDWVLFSELDPELEISLFPSWLLMNKPALAKNSVISDIEGDDAMQLIKSLVCNNECNINENTIYLRAQLQQISPGLFTHYMNLEKSAR